MSLSVVMLDASIVSSTDESSGRSATWIVPSKELKWPRTFVSIAYRAMNMRSVCAVSKIQSPGVGTSTPSSVLVYRSSAASTTVPPPSALHTRQLRNADDHDLDPTCGSARLRRWGASPSPSQAPLACADPDMIREKPATMKHQPITLWPR